MTEIVRRVQHHPKARNRDLPAQGLTGERMCSGRTPRPRN
jgi:hypothetical protein